MGRIGVLVAVLLGCGLAGPSYSQPADLPELLLRVTSSDVSEEVSFVAAYVFQDSDSDLKTVEATTPYELKGNVQAMSAILRQRSVGATLQVRLLQMDRGEWRELAGGEGTVVVVNKSPGRHLVTAWDVDSTELHNAPLQRTIGTSILVNERGVGAARR
jgi:hypothetical protein